MSEAVSRKLKLPEEFPYAYETHMHTSEASACGKYPAREMVRAYKNAGYTGVIITDHFVHGNTAIDRSLPWPDWVEGFCKGYENAKAEGDRIGLQVFFGWEACYRGTEFLINGLDQQWLLEHPEIRDCTIEEQFTLVHEGGGMVVHCHPFREEFYIPEVRLFPDYADAVEVVNATHVCKRSKAHNDPLFDERADAYAIEHDKPVTAGSDMHWTDLFLGGMAFGRKLKDSRDYIRAVMGREQCVLLSGNESTEGVPFRYAYKN